MFMGTRKPNFENLLTVLRCQVPERPVLFELFMNQTYYERLAGRKQKDDSALEHLKLVVDAYAAAGYDYATIHACSMAFQTGEHHRDQTISTNEGAVIFGRASFEAYDWPDPDSYDYSALKDILGYLPDNMKLMVMGPGGVLENVTFLVGFDNLCYMLHDEPELVQDLFDAVGARLVRYYEISAAFDSVGVLMSNDDWGFNTQTFLSVEDMRKYVFPWHKKIVETIHKADKPALLHSCGYMGDVMEDIIGNMGYDGKHSYEDNILAVEKSYERWGGRIAILGGIDVDFLIRSTPEEIQTRCRGILELTKDKGGYALGSGNSIPEYIPYEKFLAMVESAHSWRP